MKISELMAELQEIQDEYGDIDVCCWPYDGQGRKYLVSSLNIDEGAVFIEA